MAVALTTIRHGDDKGNVTVINEGDEVKGLPSDVVKALKKQKLIGDAPQANSAVVDERDALQQRVAELEAALEEARKSGEKKESPTPSTPSTPSTPKA